MTRSFISVGASMGNRGKGTCSQSAANISVSRLLRLGPWSAIRPTSRVMTYGAKDLVLGAEVEARSIYKFQCKEEEQILRKLEGEPEFSVAQLGS